MKMKNAFMIMTTAVVATLSVSAVTASANEQTTREKYQAVLNDLMNSDRTIWDSSNAKFAVADINGDGEEELLVDGFARQDNTIEMFKATSSDIVRSTLPSGIGYTKFFDNGICESETNSIINRVCFPKFNAVEGKYHDPFETDTNSIVVVATKNEEDATQIFNPENGPDPDNREDVSYADKDGNGKVYKISGNWVDDDAFESYCTEKREGGNLLNVTFQPVTQENIDALFTKIPDAPIETTAVAVTTTVANATTTTTEATTIASTTTVVTTKSGNSTKSTIKNVKTEDSALPKTGDSALPMTAGAIALVACAIGFIVKKKHS